MMIPKNQKNTDSLAFILEFKVRNPGKEKIFGGNCTDGIRANRNKAV